MEGQTEGEPAHLLAQLHQLEPEGHHPGKAYSQDAKILTLHCYLSLLQGDKDHRKLSSSHALDRTAALLGVAPRTISYWLESLQKGELAEEKQRGKPSCPHHTISFSAKQLGKLRQWILE